MYKLSCTSKLFISYFHSSNRASFFYSSKPPYLSSQTMHFSIPALLTASLLSRTISAYPHHPSGISGLIDLHPLPLPFQFQPLFAANLILGRPSQPIAIPGGILINEPITGGTVSGPAINGTVQGGFAHPAVYGNGGAMRRQVPVIDVYGVSDDGESFYIHETGVGSLTAQVTRIVRFFSLFFLFIPLSPHSKFPKPPLFDSGAPSLTST